jgi:antitoxin MazE
MEAILYVAKWGNSLAVRLPKAVVERLGLKPGDEIEIAAAAPGRIEIARDGRREAAIARMRGRALPIPEGYRFDRDEANER